MDLLRKLAGQTYIHFIIGYFYIKDVISTKNSKLLINFIPGNCISTVL